MSLMYVSREILLWQAKVLQRLSITRVRTSHTHRERDLLRLRDRLVADRTFDLLFVLLLTRNLDFRLRLGSRFFKLRWAGFQLRLPFLSERLTYSRPSFPNRSAFSLHDCAGIGGPGR